MACSSRLRLWNSISRLVLSAILLVLTGCAKDINELLKYDRDQGVIGEAKTRVVKPTSGVIILRNDESSVTPFVVRDETLFGSPFGDTYRLRYAFRFTCLGWRYNIVGYLANPGADDRVCSPVLLESPDKKTRVTVELLDVALSAPFNHPLTEEQIQQQRAAQDKLDLEYKKTEATGIIVRSRSVSPYPDPLSREERIDAAKEVISRLLGKGVDGYKLAEGNEIAFSVEKVFDKEFVRGEADLNAGDSKKKCAVWALNVSGYRLKSEPDKRRANTWLCQVISDPADFSGIIAKASRIPETLKFAASDQNVYPDLRD